MTRKKFFKIVRLILINLIVIFVFLIIVDKVLVKVVNEDEGISRQINFKENQPFSKLKIAPYPEDENQTPVVKRTDRHGLILGPGEESTDEIDIIFLGSSTVESENVRENKRYPYLSIKKLNDKLDTDFTSRNAGVGGNLLSASNLILTTKILDLKPDYVVLSSSLIDMLYLSRNKSYWTGSKKYLVEINPGTSLLKSTKDYFFPNLWLQARKFTITSDKSDFQSTKFSPEDKNRILKHYERQLDIFIKTCLTYDITPILSTDYYVPEIVQENLIRKGIFNSEEVNYYLNILIPELNTLIVNKAEEFEIPVIKFHEVEKNKDYVNNDDGVHLTNRGSEKISEVISDYLARKVKNEEI